MAVLRYLNGTDVEIDPAETVLDVKLCAARMHDRAYPEIALLDVHGAVLVNSDAPPSLVHILVCDMLDGGEVLHKDLERAWEVILKHAARNECVAGLRVLAYVSNRGILPVVLNRVGERFYDVVRKNDTVVAQNLLLIGVVRANDILIRNMFFDGRALGVAIKEGCVEMVKLLLQWRANPNDVWRGWLQGSARSSFGWNERAPALFYAAYCGHNGVLEALLELDCNVNVRAGSNASTALIECTLHNNIDGIELLLRHHADIGLKTEQGKTALMVAEDREHDKAAALLRKSSLESVIRLKRRVASLQLETPLKMRHADRLACRRCNKAAGIYRVAKLQPKRINARS